MTKKWRYDVVMEYYDGDTGIYLYIIRYYYSVLNDIIKYIAVVFCL